MATYFVASELGIYAGILIQSATGTTPLQSVKNLDLTTSGDDCLIVILNASNNHIEVVKSCRESIPDFIERLERIEPILCGS